MQTGLSIVRESGRVADYKFNTLDESVAALRYKLDST